MNYKIRSKNFVYSIVWQSLVVAIFGCLFVAQQTKAADFSFNAPSGVSLNQQFQVDVLVGTETELINALEGKITYDSDLLSLEEVREAGTVISLWAKDPAQHKDGGVIEFSGITPGGFNTADHTKNVFSLVFKSLKEGQAQIQAQNFVALLNDGQGTRAKVSLSKLPTITIDKDAALSNPVETMNDQEPPEPPFIEIIQDSSIENGQWVAVFYGQDKQSGIDHYEIAEEKGKEVFDYSALTWKPAQSPQLLADQSRKSVVYLKVVDNAGNDRVVLVSSIQVSLYKNVWFWCIIILSVSLLYFGGNIWYKKKRSSNRFKR